MEENSSSAEEIPFKAKKSKVEEEKSKTANMADDESMEEDEYAVEKILGHRFGKRGALELRVKWQGYPAEEATWEPEAHLDGCPDELKEYYDKVGGKPDPRAKSSSAKPGPPRKRKFSPQLPTRPARSKQDQQSKNNGTGAKGGPDPATGTYPDGSWEDHVLNVDTMERDDATGRIYVYIVWKNNAKSKHPTEVVYMKCPQKCLQFYEANLQFFPGKSQAPAPTANMESKSEEVSDDEPEETVDVSVKGVASSIA